MDRAACPSGSLLHRHAADQQGRRIIYRAPAQTCNGCALKPQCTDSHEGRSREVQPDPWVGSTMARFHRGLSLMLLLLAELVLTVSWWMHRSIWTLALLAALGVALLRLTQRFFTHSRR
ncbi:MAG: hypothetical protein ACRD01_11040 [Terriglobales bacterium]